MWSTVQTYWSTILVTLRKGGRDATDRVPRKEGMGDFGFDQSFNHNDVQHVTQHHNHVQHFTFDIAVDDNDLFNVAFNHDHVFDFAVNDDDVQHKP